MDFKDIDQKRQQKRKDTGIYTVKEDSSKSKFYVLDMFPYPSGANLHVGHPKGYIASDTLARKKMLEGFNVLHPMGFDTFGLGTETYAIEHKMKPQVIAKQNIDTFVRQLALFGCTYDRERSFSTADPEYFKWTQRVFLQMYMHYYDKETNKAEPVKKLELKVESGKLKVPQGLTKEQFIDSQRLAYIDFKPINRCPSCKTGLANEDLDDGKCERCGSEVEQKPMKQWVLRITEYAERLIDGLDQVNRDASMKDLEKNWIGRSEGTEFQMQIDLSSFAKEGDHEVVEDLQFSVYTTRIDTVFGVSFVAIAPEHPLVEKITSKEFVQDVEHYKEAAKKKSQLERTELQKEKTGVFCGAYAINPFNKQKVPVYVADYVLANYGTGVVMAVPAHDERDYEFAKKYNLPIVQSIMPVDQEPHEGAEHRRTISAVIQRKSDGKFLFMHRKKFGRTSPVVGGIEGDEEYFTAAEREVLEETGYTTKAVRKLGRLAESNFFADNKNVWRQRVDQPILLELVDETPRIVDEEESDKHEVVWLTYEEAVQQTSHPDNLLGLNAFVKGEGAFGDYGRLINSSNSASRTVLILHGTEGNSGKNRYPRLKKNLEAEGYKIIVPDLPNSDLPDLDMWLDHLEQYKSEINEHSLIIGHSLGAPTAIQLLQKWNQPIEKLILIAPTHTDINWDEYNQQAPSYNNEQIQKVSQTSTDWAYVRSLVHHVDTFFSEDDPYIPMQVKDFYERDLGAKTQVFTDKGHFNLSGLKNDQFPELLEFIEKAYPKSESISFNGLTSEEAIPAMQARLTENNLGGKKCNYRIQDRVFSRQRYRGEPFPVVLCNHCDVKVELSFYNQETRGGIKSGIKTIETRALNPEEPERYFGNLQAGDIILAINKETHEEMRLHIQKVYQRKNLQDMREYEDKAIIKKMYWDEKKFAATTDFESLASKREFTPGYREKIDKNGIVGREFEILSPAIVPMDEKDLPLLLPDVENYEPTGTEEGPLANVEDRITTPCPRCGKPARRESNTMPGRAGSSRYFLRYMDPKNDKELVSKANDAYRKNVDVYVGGAEHVTRHMIYARFWQKFLHDIGVVSQDEPFMEYHSVGLIMGEDGRKMSKRRGNVVNPDDLIAQYGADTLRTYEMFMGPFDQAIARSTNGVSGVKKFLDKIVNLVGSIKPAGGTDKPEAESSNATITLLNQTIKKVGEDINEFKFNTAISQLMILVNHLTEVGTISRTTFESLVILVSPFAPHMAEELREQLGNEYSIFTKATWPSYDPNFLVADEVTIAVQINGKVRGTISLSRDADESEAISLAHADEKINNRITGEPKKIIYVKGKILNIIV